MGMVTWPLVVMRMCRFDFFAFSVFLDWVYAAPHPNSPWQGPHPELFEGPCHLVSPRPAGWTNRKTSNP